MRSGASRHFMFPRLFRVALNHEALTSDYYREVNDSPQWSISFRRTLRDFEIASHQALIGILSDNRLWIEDEDKWIWSLEPYKSFSVKSILWSTYAANSFSPPICNLVWNNKIPPIIQFFVWMTLKKRIIVRHNLRRRRFPPEEALRQFVHCVRSKRSLWTICYASVASRGLCGFCSWDCLDGRGFLVVEWRIYWWLGWGAPLEVDIEWLGKWFRPPSFRQFGKSAMGEF